MEFEIDFSLFYLIPTIMFSHSAIWPDEPWMEIHWLGFHIYFGGDNLV